MLWSFRCGVVSVIVPCVLSYVYSKQPILGLTLEWFRELSLSRLDGGVHDRLHIYPPCEIFFHSWHRHQIEGTDGFYCLLRKTQRYTICNVESQVFHLKYDCVPVRGSNPDRRHAKRACYLGVLQRKKIKKIRDYYGSGWEGPGLTLIFFWTIVPK